jgi:hypothetical protein
METIAKHKTKLLSTYKQSLDSARTVASAKYLAMLVLTADDVLIEKHRKKILTEVLWMLSEANGKYDTRYRSSEVVRLAKEEPTSEVKIQHEHVFPRKGVIENILSQRQTLLADPKLLQDILDKTVGCVVTEEQHKSLSKTEDGWDRYKGIEVLDMSHNPPLVMKWPQSIHDPVPVPDLSKPLGTKLLQLEFWQQLSEFAISNKTPLQPRSPTRGQYYCIIPIGRSDCHISLTILIKENQIGCQIYIPKSKQLFNDFYSNKEAIEKDMKIEGLSWQDLPNPACRIQASYKFDFENQQREEAFIWLLQTANTFKTVFSKPWSQQSQI